MKNILILQQKGGCGKSLLACEIARSLQRTGIPSTLYDLDGQGGYIIPPYKEPDAQVGVVDTPGQLQEKMSAWVQAADVIVVPTRCSRPDMQPLLRTLEIVKENRKEDAKLVIVLNAFTRWTSSRDFLAWIQKQSIDGAEIVTLPQSETIVQAGARGKSVVDYKPRSDASVAVLKVVNTIRSAAELPEEHI